jgi:hypothetical protein
MAPICRKFTPIVAAGSDGSLGELMREVVEQAFASHMDDVAGLTRPYIHAVALLVITDGIDIDVFAVTPRAQSEEQE